MLEAHAGFPKNAAANQNQRRSQGERRSSFDAGVAVGMRLISRMCALAAGVDHQKIRQQVGKRMQSMRDQRLGMGQPANDQLGDGHHQIDSDADPGRLLRLGRPLKRRREGGVLLKSHDVYPILLACNFSSWRLWES